MAAAKKRARRAAPKRGQSVKIVKGKKTTKAAASGS